MFQQFLKLFFNLLFKFVFKLVIELVFKQVLKLVFNLVSKLVYNQGFQIGQPGLQTGFQPCLQNDVQFRLQKNL